MGQAPRTILIVEDSLEDRELYRRYLQRDSQYAYTILESNLGEEGLNLWQQHQPDAVLLDYCLPDLDGLEFLAHLYSRSQAAYLPVIMVTGQGNETIAVQAMKAGAQDYLVKGQITPEGLQLAVNSAIEAVQLRTQLQQRIERERVVAQITQKIHCSLDLNEILQTTVTEVRQFLQTDRVLLFQVQADGWGRITTESVGVDWTPLLSTSYYDPCLSQDYLEPFRQGLITAKADIYDGTVDPCHVDLLAKLQVRANLVVPILQHGQLWGMLIAHHCVAPRHWQPLEIDLLKELAAQVGIALQQAELYQQAQAELAERRRTEVQLRDSEERFRQLAENIGAVFWVTEFPDHRVSYVSPAYKRLWGLDPAALYDNQANWSYYIHPEDHERVHQAFETKGILGQFDEEYRICLPDGTVRWVRDRCFPLRDESGQVYRLTGIAEDISDRKVIEAQRERLLQREQTARSQAEQANRIKDEFLAVLSHELRSPLNPILGWSKLLQTRSFDPARTREALATIERNARLQAQLIDDLLDIAKILRGKLSITMAPVDLTFVIEAAIDTVRSAAIAKSIRLEADFSPIGHVLGDEARLQQIIWNLLSNAIKFTPAQGQVGILLAAVDGQAQITISDTGKGITPGFLPHIFESFRQEDASTTRQYGGLGLGLAIVYSLVEAHGGTIAATSPGEGLGATFTIQFPLLQAQPESHASSGLSPADLDLTGIRILAVDDDLDARELLTAVLTQVGAEVLVVASAAEVLSHWQTFQPDILVSDIGMTEMDGYELITQIRQFSATQGGQIPAIALTAYAREEDYQQAIHSGYQHHIPKPLDPDHLVRVVRSLPRP